MAEGNASEAADQGAVLKKAKDSLRDQAVQDELARRREEIAKQKAGK